MIVNHKYRWLVLGVLIGTLMIVLSILASSATPTWLSLSAGGGSIASDTHRLRASFAQGQPVGTSGSEDFRLNSGFSVAFPLPGDLNGDGQVNAADLEIVAAALGTYPQSDSRADVNGDGVVDILDLAMVVINLGR